MRMTDLAHAIAPGLPIRVVGIRPGEKLHEVMITEDDNRWTYELPDRYVILAATGNASSRTVPAEGQPVSEGFRYGSNTNTEWLDEATLLQMLDNRIQ